MCTSWLDTRFIADIGANHMQDEKRCRKLVQKAAEIGCSAIKVQLYKADELWAEGFPQREKVCWELPEKFIPMLSECCQEHGISLHGTPFSHRTLHALVPYVRALKIGSYETHWDQLVRHAFHHVRNENHIQELHLSYGLGRAMLPPSVPHFPDEQQLTIYHCDSRYPVELDAVGLANLAHLDKVVLPRCRMFSATRLGWSDHTVEPTVIYAAIALGARDIEFHLDLDGQGPEYKVGHCWLPEEISPCIDMARGMWHLSNREAATNSKLQRWRTDPRDGKRPLQEFRTELLCELLEHNMGV